MKLIAALLLLVGIVNQASAQWILPQVVCAMPSVINESSGVEIDANGLFWSHNDSGGSTELFGFNTSGALVRTIDVTNAINVDWEEMAQGTDGTFYIGDFGNNSNNRSLANGTPLRIYVIPNPADIVGNSVTAGIIEFEYDNRDFAAPSNNHEFDMEAMFWWNDTLHLFNKNRTNPTNGFVKHYVLPATPGVHTAMLVDSLNNGGTRITAADISPCGRYVALLAMDRMYLISCFKGSKYLSTGFVRTFSYPTTQKEAVVFQDFKRVYITDEQTGSIGRNLYTIDLTNYVANNVQANATIVPDCGSSHSGSIQLALSGGTSPFSFLWSNGELTNPVGALFGGSYSVTVTDAQGCILDSAFTVPDFLPEVPLVLSADNWIYTQNQGAYQWYLNGVAISGATNDSLYFTQNGNYQLEFTDANGCTTLSDNLFLQFNGLHYIDKVDITCYRSGEVLKVENKSMEDVIIHIAATDGRLIERGIRLMQGSQISVNLNSHQMLLIQVVTDSGRVVNFKR